MPALMDVAWVTWMRADHCPGFCLTSFGRENEREHCSSRHSWTKSREAGAIQEKRRAALFSTVLVASEGILLFAFPLPGPEEGASQKDEDGDARLLLLLFFAVSLLLRSRQGSLLRLLLLLLHLRGPPLHVPFEATTLRRRLPQTTKKRKKSTAFAEVQGATDASTPGFAGHLETTEKKSKKKRDVEKDHMTQKRLGEKAGRLEVT